MLGTKAFESWIMFCPINVTLSLRIVIDKIFAVISIAHWIGAHAVGAWQRGKRKKGSIISNASK